MALAAAVPNTLSISIKYKALSVALAAAAPTAYRKAGTYDLLTYKLK